MFDNVQSLNTSVPASSPDNVSVEVLSSTSIMVTWEVIPPVDQNGIIITYEVLYEPLETFDGMIMERRLNTTNLVANLSRLQEFVNYSISVRGYTIVGPGNYSEPITVMTLEDCKSHIKYFCSRHVIASHSNIYTIVPAIAPMNVRSQVLSSTSINVTWEEIPPIMRNGIITVYEVLYVPLETFGGAIGSENVNTTGLFYELVGLEEYVNYNISVRAYTRVGFGPYSDGHIETYCLGEFGL